ncbi:MAG TPA: hypothetical protein PKE16_04870 [Hyphomicrobium sp.]|nr:hypothetical protein [Hyphomicrobium sp.]
MHPHLQDALSYFLENCRLSLKLWEKANLIFAGAGALIAIPVSWAFAAGWEFVWAPSAIHYLAIFPGTYLLTMFLVVTPFRMWTDQKRQAEAVRAEAKKDEPLSLLDFARLAEEKFGWDLFSDSASTGWQTWDLTDGLKHAANESVLTFEGKRFAIYSSPPDNPFLRRGELYQKIEPGEWLKLMLTISVPGSKFASAIDNFELSICSELAGNNTQYWDARITDRSAAARWLESQGRRLKGESEKFHAMEEKRKEQQKAAWDALHAEMDLENFPR